MEFDLDTIIVPAERKGFEEVFIGNNAWWKLRLSKDKLKQLKYIAVYRKRPVSAITHYAIIDRIEKYENSDEYAIYFKGKPIEITPIKYDAKSVAPQKQRYTTLEKILKSKTLSDILGL